MSIERRLESLEARLGRPSPISYSDVQAAELRLAGGVPIREQLVDGHIMRPDYPGKESDLELVERFYSQYRTRRDDRAWLIKKIDAIAERIKTPTMRDGEN